MAGSCLSFPCLPSIPWSRFFSTTEYPEDTEKDTRNDVSILMARKSSRHVFSSLSASGFDPRDLADGESPLGRAISRFARLTLKSRVAIMRIIGILIHGILLPFQASVTEDK